MTKPHLSKKLLWQQSLVQAITDPAELLQILQLNPALISAVIANPDFRLTVPREFVARMQKGNPRDPLLLQILPLIEEAKVVDGYVADPLQEMHRKPLPGLLHKYHGRILLTLSGICAINCRYCFRREFPYRANHPDQQAIIDYLMAHPTVKEVILSGGDPLAMPDRTIKKFATQLLTLPQIKTLRIHTRLPVVIPARITDEFCQWLQDYPLRKVIIIHCNHPQEIDQTVIAAMQKLRQVNVTLLNQSVLLKNINDDAATLIALSEKLFSAGVLPYYLHLLDKVRGAAHFAVSEIKAKQLKQQLKEQLSGYLVPKFVKEKPGVPHKTAI